MSNWTPEPWSPSPCKTVTIDSDDYDRARLCVNALADIDNPEAFVRQAKAAIGLAEAIDPYDTVAPSDLLAAYLALKGTPNA